MPQTHAGDSPRPQVFGLIGLVLVAGVGSLWPGPSLASIDWVPLILLTALTVLAEVFAVDTSGRGKTSIAVVIVLASTFLYGTPGIFSSVLALTITVGTIGHSPLHRMLFNFGTLVLSAQGARVVFMLVVGDPFGQQPLALMLLPAAAAGLAYYGINHFLLSLVRALAEARPLGQIWRTEYRWLWPHYPVMGVLAVTIAIAYHAFGSTGLVAFLAPMAMMQLVITQYLGHTRGYVVELQRLNEQLAEAYESTLEALSRALDTRDEATEAHAQRVRQFTDLITRQLGLPDALRADVTRGALLHDIGKIGVPDAILRKPGPLTDTEWALMRQHPRIGYAMIAHIPFLAGAAEVVLHHHEAYDGSGYPSGLVGAAIPLGARIFAVADAFDAITSERPYKQARSVQFALDEIRRHRGRQFDPQVVDAFIMVAPDQ